MAVLGPSLQQCGRRFSTPKKSVVEHMPIIVNVPGQKGNIPEGHERWDSLSSGIKALKCGRVVALPTDTIYGIAALAQNPRAVQQLYHIKRRIQTKPVAICVSDVKQVYQWCEVTIGHDLLKSLLPGPVTLVFTRKRALNPALNPGVPLVGVRIPEHFAINELCRELDEPIALTSANVSDCRSAVSIDEFEELWPDLSVIYDGGRLGETEEQRLGSTVVNLSVQGQFSIIRPGSAYDVTRRLLQENGLLEST